jgi:transcriptional regulator with XRE-family HTH domain
MADLVFLDPRRRPRPLLRTLVGDVLRRHRQEQGRTLADVARAAMVSMPYLSEVERGRKEASSEVLAAVCEALRIALSDLLAEVWRDLAAEPGLMPRPDPAADRPGLRAVPGREAVPGRDAVPGRRAFEPGRGVAGGPAGRGVARPARGSADVVLLAA